MQGIRWLLVLQAYRLTLLEGATASPLKVDEGAILNIDRFEHVHDSNKSTHAHAIDYGVKIIHDESVNYNQSEYSENLLKTPEHETENKTMKYLDKLINEIKNEIIRQGHLPTTNKATIITISGRRKLNKLRKDDKVCEDTKLGKDVNSSKDAKLSEDDSEGTKRKEAEKSKLTKKRLKKSRKFKDSDLFLSEKEKKKRACFFKKKQGDGKGPADHPICCNCCKYSVLGCS